MAELDYESTYKKSAAAFTVKEYLLLGGGPSNCSERVLNALSRQCIIHTFPDMHTIMDEVKSMLQHVLQTKNKFTLVNQTSGNGGNEAILTNLLDPRDTVIIAIGGTWGEKMVDMAMRYNYNVVALRKPPGEVFTLEELEAAVSTHKAKLLFVTHGESTGGTLQPLEGLGAMCHQYNCLFAVDVVVSIAVVPIYVDRWEIDAVNGGSQKGIGAPPGLALLSFSPRAEKLMRTKKSQPPYYLDMIRQGIYWNCFDEGPSRTYHYTFSSNLLAALREALAEICEEGLPRIWERHVQTARLFFKRLHDIGCSNFVEKPENRFHGVTCVQLPPGVDIMEIVQFLQDKYGIQTTPGHGPTLGKAIRFGFLGRNSRPEVVEYLIGALSHGFRELRRK